MRGYSRYLGSVEAFLFVTACSYSWGTLMVLFVRWPWFFEILGLIVVGAVMMGSVVVVLDGRYG